jgi:hypothetical protein
MGVLFMTVSKHPAGLLIFKRRKVPDPSIPLREPHFSIYKACEDVEQNAVFGKDKRSPVTGPLWPRRFQEV